MHDSIRTMNSWLSKRTKGHPRERGTVLHNFD